MCESLIQLLIARSVLVRVGIDCELSSRVSVEDSDRVFRHPQNLSHLTSLTKREAARDVITRHIDF